MLLIVDDMMIIQKGEDTLQKYIFEFQEVAEKSYFRVLVAETEMMAFQGKHL